MHLKRKRPVSLILLTLVLIAGLLSRKFNIYLSDGVNTYLGDALWACMIYVGIGFLFPKWSIQKTGLAGLTFCYLIELSQWYHADWIDGIRQTTLGGLILGFGFLWSDLVAYALGIAFGFAVEYAVCRLQKKN